MAVITISTPLFIKNAEDLLERLQKLEGAEVASMAAEARELLAEFRHWEHHKPPDTVRVTTIRKLFDLQRRVLDFATRPAPQLPCRRRARTRRRRGRRRREHGGRRR